MRTSIGPWKVLIVPRDEEGNLAPPTNLIDRAPAVGLAVQTYTFRFVARYLAVQDDGEPGAEYRQFFNLGVDGIFNDFPDAATRATRNLRSGDTGSVSSEDPLVAGP